MEKEIVIWTFISVFVCTAIITILGIIKNFKYIEIEEKHLTMLSKALILEIAVVIIGFGANVFNDLYEENSYKKEILELNKKIEEHSETISVLNQELSAYKKEIEIKSVELGKLNKEKERLQNSITEEIERAKEEAEAEYTFEDAKRDVEGSIYFKVKTSTIDFRSRVSLDHLVEKIGKFSNVAVRLQPHSGKDGDQEIYKSRQIAVRNYLIKKGFPAHRILFITNSLIFNVGDDIYDEDNDPIEVGLSINLAISDV